MKNNNPRVNCPVLNLMNYNRVERQFLHFFFVDKT
jgi:hypothetical protein